MGSVLKASFSVALTIFGLRAKVFEDSHPY